MQLATLGGIALSLSPADYGRLNAAEVQKWNNVVTPISVPAVPATMAAMRAYARGQGQRLTAEA